MAPFNRRQIGYIQAIAGRQQHVTLTCGQHDGQISSDDDFNIAHVPQTLDTNKVEIDGSNLASGAGDAKSLLLFNWLLDQTELCFDSRADHNNDILQAADFTNLSVTNRGTGPTHALQVFDAECKGAYQFSHLDSNGNRISSTPTAGGQLDQNVDRVLSTQRATPDGFLNSTTVKFRFTLPREVTGVGHATDHPMGQDHYEFRWIVWRSKRPTFRFGADTSGEANLDMIRNGASFRNPGYDFFKGQTGRKRGLIGYTYHPELDKDKYQNSDGTVENPTEKYSGARFNTSNAWENTGDSVIMPAGESKLTVDDVMTLPINKDDYVVMKDVRFFLGKEHGKSHFEDSLHWDWNDPIDTGDTNVLNSPTLNDKNYRWHMTLMGTSGGASPCTLNHCVRWTTKMESG